MIDRYKRYNPLQCVTCSGHNCRYKRYTPLGGVTVVTLALTVVLMVVKMMIDRHKRHKPSHRVTCAGQNCRHERHTPLGGVTVVTLALTVVLMVPMVELGNGPQTVASTVDFSLPKKSGEK
ncbi:hypothetical protein [Thioclava dalianensis]|uniref:hypothetical protein n=1 Tax=Thioclava dalianensis TaxID=1185766 RepID=UPI0012DD1ECC|nr:hypothetical protein [Thioclava dalianensis]